MSVFITANIHQGDEQFIVFVPRGQFIVFIIVFIREESNVLSLLYGRF